MTVVIYHNNGNAEKFEHVTFTMTDSAISVGKRRFMLRSIARIEAYDDKT